MSSRLLIGEAADLLGLTTKALRHYEKLGLIAPVRSDNGYRVYTADHVLRLLRIRRLQSLGLSLTQIKTLLDEDNDAQVWQAILRALLDKVDDQIDALEDRREELERLIADGGADALAVPDELPVPLQRAQEYLDQHLIGAKASLWAAEKPLYALPDQPSALEDHIAMLWRLLAEPPVTVYARRFVPGHHRPASAPLVAGVAALISEEDYP